MTVQDSRCTPRPPGPAEKQVRNREGDRRSMVQIVSSTNMTAGISLANFQFVPELFFLLAFTLLVLFFVANFVVLGLVFRSAVRGIRVRSTETHLAKLPKHRIPDHTAVFSQYRQKQASLSFGVDRMGSTFVHGIPLKTTDHVARHL